VRACVHVRDFARGGVGGGGAKEKGWNLARTGSDSSF